MAVAESTRRGIDAFKRKEWSEADRYFTQSLEKDPNSVGLLINRSSARFQAQRYEESLKDAEAAAKLKPDSAKAHYRAALANHRLQRASAAVRGLTKAVDLALPTDEDARRLSKQAKDALKAEDQKKSHGQGDAAGGGGDGVDDPAEAKRLGAAKFKDADYENAAHWFGRAIELANAKPGTVPDSEIAIYHTNRAACLSQEHKWKLVIDDCDAALKLAPTAMAYEGLEKWQKAADDYRQVMMLDTTQTSALASMQRCEKLAKQSM